jgi:prepilin-type processing-associated H-X9-DG protein
MTSELKVDKITPASGTSTQIGDSGDTITIPSGCTITNSGTASGFGGLTNWSESSGNLLPSNASYGVYLGVNSATASNLLDDFEEGTYTYAMTTSGGGTVSNRSGYSKLAYTKIGRMVNVVGKIETSGLGDFAAQNGDIRLSLPFAIGNFDDFSEQFASPVMWYNTASMSSMNMLFWDGSAGDSFCRLVNISSTLVDSGIQGNEPGSSFEMKVSITYQAA